MMHNKMGDVVLKSVKSGPRVVRSTNRLTQNDDREFWQELRALAAAWRVQRDKLPRDHRRV